ncbi:site-specific DNA-methyltransferase [Trinickia mobilis]|uniref:site-specific DNA-methyltransferase n=1 Tax=Trinickia mobilis TaxID=2816356 RepID=UPI001A8FE64D|nr:site-specific DNA-methyltransferase [Trinickia mobilis]
MKPDLLLLVAAEYAGAPDGALANDELYARIAPKIGMPESELGRRVPVGKSGQFHSPEKRRIRWIQQTLKHMGVLSRAAGSRGVWQLAEGAGKELHRACNDVALVAFSTNLGIAVWGACRTVFNGFKDEITLVFTSPPFPLAKPRAYGNPTEKEYVDFLCRELEPLICNLVPGGSVCINVSNDCFLSGSPARSLYRERLVIALCERLGLYKMDELIWHNRAKAPGPVQWASKARVQLNVSWEPIYWFTNDPMRVKADNRRVLGQHTERHLQLMARGGEARSTSYGDGAYRVRPGSFGKPTPGAIPRNVLEQGHRCSDTLQYRQDAIRLGLPVHGAMMPVSIARFLVNFLSEPNDLVVDLFGGSLKTAVAAQELGRRWLVTEWIIQYVRAAAERFRGYPDFWMNPKVGDAFC